MNKGPYIKNNHYFHNTQSIIYGDALFVFNLNGPCVINITTTNRKTRHYLQSLKPDSTLNIIYGTVRTPGNLLITNTSSFNLKQEIKKIYV